MCGIWASVGLRPTREVLDVVAHRGPDGQGWQEFESPAGPVVLGHRRLAIIDISDRGLQPMPYASDRFWLTYNGVIYNYLELRAELEDRGHRFRSRTDSEVVLAAYAEWRESCLDRLNGMFAFAIWDDRDRVLFAARDRFGIKPLYLYRTPAGFALASEIKQFTVLRDFAASLNLPRAYDFLAAGSLDHTCETLFAAVEQIRGGACLRVALDRRPAGPAPEPVIRSWYALPEPGTIRCTEREAAERYRALLDDSVRLQLRSDVPLGSCLSGGLDSSSIVCLMRSHLAAEDRPSSQKTFSAVYADSEVDESRFVDAVVERTGVESLRTSPAGEDLFPQLRRLTWHQDEPFGSTSIFAQWEVFRLAASSGIKVMLDGQGADEQLGGYHHMYGTFHAGLLRSLRLGRLIRELRGQARRLGTPFGSQLRSLVIGVLPASVLRSIQALRHGSARPDWLDAPAWRDGPDYRSPVPMALDRAGLPGITDLGGLCRAQVTATNLPKFLHYEDRNSMAHSIEARVPFLDHRVVEFAIGLGSEHKIVAGESKRVLRRGLGDMLPAMVAKRQDKLGFATPEKAWMQGPLREPLTEGVAHTIEKFPDLFDKARLTARIEGILDGAKPFDSLPWRIVSFGVWADIFNVSA